MPCSLMSRVTARNRRPVGCRPSFKGSYLNENILNRVRSLNEIAQKRGQSLAQMALAWLLANPVVTAPIIGPRTMEQLTSSARPGDQA